MNRCAEISHRTENSALLKKNSLKSEWKIFLNFLVYSNAIITKGLRENSSYNLIDITGENENTDKSITLEI